MHELSQWAELTSGFQSEEMEIPQQIVMQGEEL